ncbi:EDD domain protein [Oenococcus oeni]|uniref:DegV family protein n=1 Tax=Oenococcus oeni TaxID=1247 RepID=UPI0009527C27|nr:DegV family protein [Oenococcus oeni]OLQ33084.1 EDD domain protein [Oenococcus oeni]
MVKNVAVIVDSSFYIPKEEQQKYNIYVIPTPIIFNGRIKYDSDWSSAAKFFKDMNSAKKMPSTSMASPADVLKAFEQVRADGYRQAILMTMASGISGFYNMAVNLANDYQELDVQVWDSKFTLMVSGVQALLAAELSAQGITREEIMKKVALLRDSTRVFIVVDDISHLKRTGRLAGGAALVAGLLNIKPILVFNKASKIVAIGKERQMKRAWNWLLKQYAIDAPDFDRPIRVLFADANNRALMENWQADFHEKYPDVITDFIPIGPLIGVHTGEKAVGFVYMDDWKDIARHH